MRSSPHRHQLPHLDGGIFLTDGGIETTLIFEDGIDLPYFAAYPLLDGGEREDLLRRRYEAYATIAERRGTGLLLETPTWRANADWGRLLDHGPEELDRYNRRAVALLEEIRTKYASPSRPVVLSGCIGPRGDAYDPDRLMTADEAEDYHRAQIATFAETSVDLVAALTLAYRAEAIGIVRAASASDVPVVISFTVEVDGSLPTGGALGDAIEAVDAATDGHVIYYGLNCAHPSHLAHVLDDGGEWTRRIRALRANASRRSHAELDDAIELDRGDERELAEWYALLQNRHPQLTVLGGCCGTDEHHVAAIAEACLGKT